MPKSFLKTAFFLAASIVLLFGWPTASHAINQTTIIVQKVTTGGPSSATFPFSTELSSGYGLPGFDFPDFSITTSGGTGSYSVIVDPDSYWMRELTPPGWQLTGLTCQNPSGEISVVTDLAEGTVSISISNNSDNTITCTFTNSPLPTRLTLIKNLILNDGGTADAADWTLTAAGPQTISGITGTSAVTDVAVQAGTYTLSESGPTGYTGSWNCFLSLPVASKKSNGFGLSSFLDSFLHFFLSLFGRQSALAFSFSGNQVTIVDGESVTCIATNDDNPGGAEPTWSATHGGNRTVVAGGSTSTTLRAILSPGSPPVPLTGDPIHFSILDPTFPYPEGMGITFPSGNTCFPIPTGTRDCTVTMNISTTAATPSGTYVFGIETYSGANPSLLPTVFPAFVLTVNSPPPGSFTVTKQRNGASSGGPFTMELYDSTFTFLDAHTFGDTETSYTFTPLPPGTYSIVEETLFLPAGWSFVSSTCNNRTVSSSTTTPCQITNSFTATTFPLTVSVGGTGTGTVTSFPSGINCSSGSTGDCSENYNDSDVVDLFASAGGSSVFAGWSGACSGTGSCSVTMSAAQSVTATFNAGATPTDLQVVHSGYHSGPNELTRDAVVQNTGASGVPAGIVVAFYYNRTTAPGPTDTPDATITTASPIGSGGSLLVLPNDVQGGVPPGEYMSWARVDYTNIVAETNENNNVSGPLDLEIHQFTASNEGDATLLPGSSYIDGADTPSGQLGQIGNRLTAQLTGASPTSQVQFSVVGTNPHSSQGVNVSFQSGITTCTAPAPGGSCSVTLLVNTSSSTPAGSYPFTVEALEPACGSATLTTTNFTVTVGSGPTQGLTLTATPLGRSVTVPPQAQTTFTVNGTPSGGFTGPVTLSTSGLTGGFQPITTNFTPMNCNGTTCNSSTLTVTVGPDAQEDSTSFNILGAGPGGTPSADTGGLQFSISRASESFTLTALPNPQTIPQGGSTTYNVSVNSSGYTGTIHLSPSGLPAGMSATFNPSVVGNPQIGRVSCTTPTNCTTSVMTVNAGTAQPQAFRFNVHGEDQSPRIVLGDSQELYLEITGSGLNGLITVTKARQPFGTAPDGVFNFTGATLPTVPAGTPYTSFSIDTATSISEVQAVGPGTYTVREDALPPGWTFSNLICDTFAASVSINQGTRTATITMSSFDGAWVNCSFHNTATLLTLQKIVVNDDSGGASESDWTLRAVGPQATVQGISGTSAVTNVLVPAGTYNLSEINGPTGYTASAWTCTPSGIPVLNPNTSTLAKAIQYVLSFIQSVFAFSTTPSSVTLLAGEQAICTITNNDNPLPEIPLNVTIAGSGSGFVTSTPGVISCPGICTDDFTSGTFVSLDADPTNGSVFAGWSGGGCSGTSSCVVNMTAAQTVTATFDPPPTIPFTITKQRTGTTSNATFNFTITGPGFPPFPIGNPFSINTSVSSSHTFPALVVGGTYTLIELSASPAPTGGSWVLDTNPCGSPFTVTDAVPSCTVNNGFNPTPTATIRVDKAFTGDPLPANPPTFRFAASGAGIIPGPGSRCDMTPPVISCTISNLPVDIDVTVTESIISGSTVGWTIPNPPSQTIFTDFEDPFFTMLATNDYTAPTSTLTVTKSGPGDGTVSGPGIDCDPVDTDCSEIYQNGTEVTLSALPDANSTFTSWNGGGCTGTGPCIFNINTDTTVTANFALASRTLTVQVSGSGRVDGPGIINCRASSGDCTQTYPHGTSVSLSASPDAGFVFNGWSGSQCGGQLSSPCVFNITSDESIQATFNVAPPTTGSITVNKNRVGATTGGPFTWELYDEDDIFIGGVSILDTTTSFTFSPLLPGNYTVRENVTSLPPNWTLTDEASCADITVNAGATTPCTITNTFVPTFTLTVNKSGTGNGTVSGSGIACGASCFTQSVTLSSGTQVTLTAVPDATSNFTSWNGGPCSGVTSTTCGPFTFTAPTTITAQFTRITHALNVAVINSGGTGRVDGPGIINCRASSGDCGETYVTQTPVTLTAQADSGSIFAGWGGSACSGSVALNCAILMDSPHSIQATFNVAPPTTGSITVNKNRVGATTGGPFTWELYDEDDIFIGGVSILDTTTSFTFSPLLPGNYTVRENVTSLPPNWTLTDEASCADITVNAGATTPCTITNTFLSDFSLTATPALPQVLTVLRGSSGSYGIYVDRDFDNDGTPDFPELVSFSVADLPSDTTWSFTPSATLGTTSVLELVTMDTTPNGTYRLTITGEATVVDVVDARDTDSQFLEVTQKNKRPFLIGGAIQHIVQVDFRVEDPPPNMAALTLEKNVINDNGGSASPSQWTLTAFGPVPPVGPPPIAFQGITGVSGAVPPGTYVLGESGGPSGYSSTAPWVCVGGGTFTPPNRITLAIGDNVFCEKTNNDIPPTLRLIKEVTGITPVPPLSNWTLRAAGPIPAPTIVLSGPGSSTGIVTGPTFQAGVYALTETGPGGYTLSWSCIGGSPAGPNLIDLDVGETATCTARNTFASTSGSIEMSKQVFPLSTLPNPPVRFTFTASPGGQSCFVDVTVIGQTYFCTINGLTRGQSYTVVETAPPGWQEINPSCGSIFIPATGTPTCFRQNGFTLPPAVTITVSKTSTGGGGPFGFTINGPGIGPTPFTITTPTSGGTASFPSFTQLPVGQYTITEVSNPSGAWTRGIPSCSVTGSGGSIVSTGSGTATFIVGSGGGAASCNFPNTLTTTGNATLRVTKQTRVTGGGPFTFSVSGPSSIPNFTISTTAPDVFVSREFTGLSSGTYTITETPPPGWVVLPGTQSSQTITISTFAEVAFYNTPAPSTPTLTVTKDTTGGTGGPFGFSVNLGVTVIDSFSLDTDPSTSTSNTRTLTATLTPGFQYRVFETQSPLGWGPPQFSPSCPGGLVTIPTTGNITCTVTNAAPVAVPVTITVSKTSTGGGGPFGFTINGPGIGPTPFTITTPASGGTASFPSFTQLPVGQYTITEVSNPSGAWTRGTPVCTGPTSSISPGPGTVTFTVGSSGGSIGCNFPNSLGATSDYQISISPSLEIVTPPQSANYTITLAYTNFTAPVTLTFVPGIGFPTSSIAWEFRFPGSPTGQLSITVTPPENQVLLRLIPLPVVPPTIAPHYPFTIHGSSGASPIPLNPSPKPFAENYIKKILDALISSPFSFPASLYHMFKEAFAGEEVLAQVSGSVERDSNPAAIGILGSTPGFTINKWTVGQDPSPTPPPIFGYDTTAAPPSAPDQVERKASIPTPTPSPVPLPAKVLPGYDHTGFAIVNEQLVAGVPYYIEETVPIGWTYIDAKCFLDQGGARGPEILVAESQAGIIVTFPGQNVICDFYDRKGATGVIINKWTAGQGSTAATFGFDATEPPPAAPDQVERKASIPTTVPAPLPIPAGVRPGYDGFGSTILALTPDRYFLEETVPQGWTYIGADCWTDRTRTQPVTVTPTSAGIDVIIGAETMCDFYDRLGPGGTTPPPPPTGDFGFITIVTDLPGDPTDYQYVIDASAFGTPVFLDHDTTSATPQSYTTQVPAGRHTITYTPVAGRRLIDIHLDCSTVCSGYTIGSDDNFDPTDTYTVVDVLPGQTVTTTFTTFDPALWAAMILDKEAFGGSEVFEYNIYESADAWQADPTDITGTTTIDADNQSSTDQNLFMGSAPEALPVFPGDTFWYVREALTAEQAAAGWGFGSVLCENDSGTDICDPENPTPGCIRLDTHIASPGEVVTCTFKNYKTSTGQAQLIVKKEATGGSSTDSFHYDIYRDVASWLTVPGSTIGTRDITNLSPAPPPAAPNVLVGTATTINVPVGVTFPFVREVLTPAQTAVGWTLTDVQCQSQIGSTVTPVCEPGTQPSGQCLDLTRHPAAAGETITCTYKNSRSAAGQARLVLKKEAAGGSEVFNYNIYRDVATYQSRPSDVLYTRSISATVPAGTGMFTGTAADIIVNVGDTYPYAQEVFTSSQTAAGWRFDSVSCVDQTGADFCDPSIPPTAGCIDFSGHQAYAGETITCTYKNTKGTFGQPLACQAVPSPVAAGSAVSATATGGNGTEYSWTSLGGSPETGTGRLYSTFYSNASVGVQTITLTEANTSGQAICEVTVTPCPTCTFGGTMRVIVNTVGGNGTFPFNGDLGVFNLITAGSLSGGTAQQTFGGNPPGIPLGIYTVTLTLPQGWTASSSTVCSRELTVDEPFQTCVFSATQTSSPPTAACPTGTGPYVEVIRGARIDAEGNPEITANGIPAHYSGDGVSWYADGPLFVDLTPADIGNHFALAPNTGDPDRRWPENDLGWPEDNTDDALRNHGEPQRIFTGTDRGADACASSSAPYPCTLLVEAKGNENYKFIVYTVNEGGENLKCKVYDRNIYFPSDFPLGNRQFYRFDIFATMPN